MTPRATLYLTAGLPGSGKTTWATRLAREQHILRLTPDDWMAPLFGHSDAGGRRDVLEGRLIWVAHEALVAGAAVILDFGCWSPEERYAIRSVAEAAGAQFVLQDFELTEDERRARAARRWADTPATTFAMSDADHTGSWRHTDHRPRPSGRMRRYPHRLTVSAAGCTGRASVGPRWGIWTPGCRDDRHMTHYPQLLQTVLDTTQPRALAEFYRELLGLHYRLGDEPPTDGAPDDVDWLVLVDDQEVRRLAFQQVEQLTPTTWPSPEVPMQLHLDCTVPTVEQLAEQRRRAESLGARLILDRTDDADEPLYVFADLAGHPFCIFVA
jgi:predicted kinase